jgi:hypothetical protein
MQVLKYEKESVLIQDGNLKAWVDVWIKNEDVNCDWNQNDFILTDPKDIVLKKWQENLENFEDATDLAIQTLEDAGIIYQDDNGKWHSTKN